MHLTLVSLYLRPTLVSLHPSEGTVWPASVSTSLSPLNCSDIINQPFCHLSLPLTLGMPVVVWTCVGISGGRENLAALCFPSAMLVPLQQNLLAVAVMELSEGKGGTETLGFGRKGHVNQKVKQSAVTNSRNWVAPHIAECMFYIAQFLTDFCRKQTDTHYGSLFVPKYRKRKSLKALLIFRFPDHMVFVPWAGILLFTGGKCGSAFLYQNHEKESCRGSWQTIPSCSGLKGGSFLVVYPGVLMSLLEMS